MAIRLGVYRGADTAESLYEPTGPAVDVVDGSGEDLYLVAVLEDVAAPVTLTYRLRSPSGPAVLLGSSTGTGAYAYNLPPRELEEPGIYVIEVAEANGELLTARVTLRRQ
jgi:hypothetical protein